MNDKDTEIDKYCKITKIIYCVDIKGNIKILRETSLLDSLIHQRANSRSKKNYNSAA